MIPQLSFYKYNPIYQGAPIEEAAKAMEMGAKAFDTNLENYNKLQSFAASIKALPQDQQYVRDKILSADSAIKDIADQTSGTKRWDKAGDAVQRISSIYFSDPKLNAVRESYTNFNEGEKVKQDMRAKGMTPFETTDFSKHRSFDEEGNVNIYRPVIEPKADYVKEADSIWKAVEPDIAAANLQPSEIEGILQGQTIKGISREKILASLDNVQKTYNETDAGQQHKRFIAQNTPNKDPDKTVRDFLFGIGSLKQFKEVKTERMADPSYEYEQRAKLLQQKIEGDLLKKKATGRGNYMDGNERLFRVEALKSKGEVGQERVKGNALMINNPVIIEGFSKSQFTGDGSRIVPLNKNQKFDMEKDQVTGMTIKGFALDDYEGEDSVGGMIGEARVTGEDGKERNMNVLLKNSDPEVKNLFSTYRSLSAVLKTQAGGNKNLYKNKSVVDTSGLLDFTGKEVYFKVTPDNEIIPVGKTKEGTYSYFTESERDALLLKPKYSMKDIQNLLIDKIAPRLLPYTETASQLNK